jgi:hypothetical protein
MCRRVICLTLGVVCVLILYLLNDPGKIIAADAAATKQPAATKISDQATTQTSAASERGKIWNSPEMLRARAWLEEYFRVTRKYTPEQKQEYRQHLQEMTAPQMEMWLMRFQQDRQAAQKDNRAEQQVRGAAVSQDLGVIQQNRRVLQNINQGENAAAAREQKVINKDQQFARSMYKQKQRESAEMMMEYSSGFGWGFGGGF